MIDLTKYAISHNDIHREQNSRAPKKSTEHLEEWVKFWFQCGRENEEKKYIPIEVVMSLLNSSNADKQGRLNRNV